MKATIVSQPCRCDVGRRRRHRKSGDLAMRWAWAASCAVLVGCSGFIYPPGGQQTPLTNPATGKCPAVSGTQGSCGGVHFLKSSLTCGGDGKMHVALSTITGGGTRFNVDLQNGSVFSGELITPDPACIITSGQRVVMEFGLEYTGDQGLEVGTMAPCIIQSKAGFSSFRVAPAGFGAFESNALDALLAQIDDAVINEVFLAPGSAHVAGRCARWREMP